MKKILASLFLAAFLISGVVGCGGGDTSKPAEPAGEAPAGEMPAGEKPAGESGS